MSKEIRLYAITPEKYFKETVEWANRNNLEVQCGLVSILSYESTISLKISPGANFAIYENLKTQEAILLNNHQTPIGIIQHDCRTEQDCSVRVIVMQPIFKTQEECGE